MRKDDIFYKNSTQQWCFGKKNIEFTIYTLIYEFKAKMKKICNEYCNFTNSQLIRFDPSKSR